MCARVVSSNVCSCRIFLSKWSLLLPRRGPGSNISNQGRKLGARERLHRAGYASKSGFRGDREPRGGGSGEEGEEEEEEKEDPEEEEEVWHADTNPTLTSVVLNPSACPRTPVPIKCSTAPAAVSASRGFLFGQMRPCRTTGLRAPSVSSSTLPETCLPGLPMEIAPLVSGRCTDSDGGTSAARQTYGRSCSPSVHLPDYAMQRTRRLAGGIPGAREASFFTNSGKTNASSDHASDFPGWRSFKYQTDDDKQMREQK